MSGLPGGCFSNNLVGNLTDAQITAGRVPCPVQPGGAPFIGVDRLNNVVAPGRAPIPANTVISADNVQTLTGLTPQQYADQASAAIGQPQGYFVFGPTGYLTNTIVPAQLRPTAIADSFDTPHTLGYNVGVQRELTTDMGDRGGLLPPRHPQPARHQEREHRVRIARARTPIQLPPFTTGPIITFGPFYEGDYDALIVNFNKRYSGRFMLGASYTYAQATDNSLGINSHPSDAFIGTVPVGHRDGDRPLERQWRVHARQRHAGAGGRHVPERTGSRQGTVRSVDRSRVPGQRHGGTALPDPGERHLPLAERLPFQPGAGERRAGRS